MPKPKKSKYVPVKENGVLNDKNITFPKGKENVILKVQKVICINYKCGKKCRIRSFLKGSAFRCTC